MARALNAEYVATGCHYCLVLQLSTAFRDIASECKFHSDKRDDYEISRDSEDQEQLQRLGSQQTG
jgi:hypothetical protein